MKKNSLSHLGKCTDYIYTSTLVSDISITRIFFSFLLFIVISFPEKATAQPFCGTTPGANATKALPSGDCDTDYTGPYHIKVYVHVVREDDNAGGFTGGQSEESIRQAFAILEEGFSALNIFFVRTCEVIDVVVSTADYNSFGIYNSLWNDPLYQYSDGIAMFFGPGIPGLTPEPTTNQSAGGKANSIPGDKLWVAGFWGLGTGNVAESRVVSHEMGHLLGLYHTEHGTWDMGIRRLL